MEAERKGRRGDSRHKRAAKDLLLEKTLLKMNLSAGRVVRPKEEKCSERYPPSRACLTGSLMFSSAMTKMLLWKKNAKRKMVC